MIKRWVTEEKRDKIPKTVNLDDLLGLGLKEFIKVMRH